MATHAHISPSPPKITANQSVWVLLTLSFIFVVSHFAVHYLKSLRARRGLPYPPGPKPLPIIGNAANVPTTMMGQRFKEMTDKYGEQSPSVSFLILASFMSLVLLRRKLGDIVYLDALGQPMIILGSHEAALELLDKRSANYSDRQDSPMREL